MVENFGYWPQTKGGRIRKRFRFREYLAIVVSDFDPTENEDDEIEYIYVMAVYKMPEDQIRLFVTSDHGVTGPIQASFKLDTHPSDTIRNHGLVAKVPDQFMSVEKIQTGKGSGGL